MALQRRRDAVGMGTRVGKDFIGEKKHGAGVVRNAKHGCFICFCSPSLVGTLVNT